MGVLQGHTLRNVQVAMTIEQVYEQIANIIRNWIIQNEQAKNIANSHEQLSQLLRLDIQYAIDNDGTLTIAILFKFLDKRLLDKVIEAIWGRRLDDIRKELNSDKHSK